MALGNKTVVRESQRCDLCSREACTGWCFWTTTAPASGSWWWWSPRASPSPGCMVRGAVGEGADVPHRGRMGVYTRVPLPWVPGPKGQGLQWGQWGWRGCCWCLWEVLAGPLSSPPLCRHPAVLPGRPHDAGLQAGPLLQGLLAVPVPGHSPGNRWEGGMGPRAENSVAL